MEKPAKTLPTRVVASTVGRSTFSFLIDLGFTIAMMFVLYYSVGIPLIINNNDFYPAINEQTSYVESAKILEVRGKSDFAYYVYTDTDETAPEDYAYKKYVDLIWTYFMESLPNNPDIDPKNAVTSTVDGASLPGYEGTVDPKSQEYGKWVYVNYFHYVEAATEHSFVPSVENDFTSKPIAGKDEKTYHYALRAELFDNGTSPYKGRYVDACAHLSTQPKLREFGNRINLARYAGTVPSFVIAPLIFFFIIPMCIPNGRTLGKLILGVAVIDFDGYSASRFQILVRQAVITFIWLLLALPWQVIAVPLFTLLMLIDYMSHVLSRRGQSLHDKIVHTVPINARKSIWFKSPEQERDFVDAHPLSPISKKLKADEEQKKEDAVTVATSALIEAEERILDLSTINRRREEARRMTSFDEFEKKSDEEFAKREEEAAARQTEEAGEEPLDPEAEEKALADLAALEGLSPDEAKALAEESSPEEDDPDAFVDEKKE